MSRFSVTFPLSFSHPTQIPFGQGLGLPHGMAPFADGRPDLFVRTAPPQQGCFVESGDEAGGGGLVKAQDLSTPKPKAEPIGPYKTVDDLFRITGLAVKNHPQAVSENVIKNFPWILAQKPGWPTAKRILEMVLDQGERDKFLKSWLQLGLIKSPEESADFLAFVRSAPITGAALLAGAHTDPAVFGLQFPQELWKDYGAWWADLEKQAKRFVKDYWQPQNNLSDREAQAKIKELLEMEKTNYERLLPLKAKAHEAIRDSLVLIPGGMFMMGADDIDNDSKPVHAVWVSSFLMMDVLVTNAMWFAVMETRPSAQYDNAGKIFSGANQPVVGVAWHEATEFAQRVGCVLPSEAQWERGAKGGGDYAYGTRDGTLSHDLAVYDNSYDNLTGHQYTVTVKNTVSVKSRPANPFGLYDMCGNVWQWCKDGWKRVYTEEPVINPIGVAAKMFILRGGSWDGLVQDLRSASRTVHPDYSHAFGFRCVQPSQDSS